ncbi:zinc finger CCCH domain-containing protein 6 [Ditylenchus destructor]|nr:zinc finger CCCH domain-containing protein 6 [Ditylenchus destructor]
MTDVMSSPSLEESHKSSPPTVSNENEDPQNTEEGELPEEGEIMEEEEESSAAATLSVPSASGKSKESNSPSKSTSRKTPSASTHSSRSAPSAKSYSSKYKDYDAKATKQAAVGEDAMLSSWVSGVQKKGRAAGSPRASDIPDPNEEYYGVAASGERRTLLSKPHEKDSNAMEDDKDYRAEESMETDAILDNQDNDYRRISDSPNRPSEKRRRLSRSPEDYRDSNYSKRHREGSPTSEFPPSGPRYRRPRPRWAEHTICKFFREGYCRDGDECAYSHNAADSHRRPDLCKYYQHGYCKKGLSCMHLHGEYPCKAFHKGECSKEQCQYSHQPLNDFTKPLFEQMMRDEELASRISLPSHPLRRKVLLPRPAPDHSSQDSQSSSDQSGYLPPPGVVMPVLSSGAPVTRAEEQAMAAMGTYGFFNPITPSSTTTVHQTPQVASGTYGSPSNVPAISAPSTIPATAPVMAPPAQKPIETIVKVEPKTEPSESSGILGGFNISQMLETITQQVKVQSPEIEDSPASPPPSYCESTQDTKLIPVVRAWKLIPMDIDPPADIAFDIIKYTQLEAFNKDPRINKIVEKRFNESTNEIGTILGTKVLEQQGMSPQKASPPNITSVIPKPADPRTKDPRKKAAHGSASSEPHSSINPGFSNSTQQPDDHFHNMIQQQIQMVNQLAHHAPAPSAAMDDVDHRSAYGEPSAPVSMQHPQQANGMSPAMFPPGSMPPAGYPGQNMGYGIDPNVMAENYPTYGAPAQGISNVGFNQPGNSQNFATGQFSSNEEPGFGNRGGGPLHHHGPGGYRGRGGYRGGRHSEGNYGGERRPRDYHGHRGNYHAGSNRDYEQQSSHSRWDHGSESQGTSVGGNRRFEGRQNGQGSPPMGAPGTSPIFDAEKTSNATVPTTTATTTETPLTLREKRKNNEYESPLARISSRY